MPEALRDLEPTFEIGDPPPGVHPANWKSFGAMIVVDTDQGAGREYRCACGWQGWSSWGHARRHRYSCPRSSETVVIG